MKIAELINEYQKRVDEIRFDMPAHEKMGAGQYYRHKLGMYEEFLRKLREVEAPDWIPITERLPEDYEDVLVFRRKNKGIYLMYHTRYGYWESNDGECFSFDDSEIIAWHPIPEDYEGEVSG